MNTWFRLYSELLDDPKIQKLPTDIFKEWINLLCLACKHDGFLPSIPDIAFAMRCSEPACIALLKVLKDEGLIDEKRGVMKPHNWDVRQYKSDSSTDRVKRFRKRSKTATETAHVTDQTRTDTEQIQNRIEKHTYGQFANIRLTEQEHGKLVSEFGQAGAQERIEGLSSYVASKGKKYASHYATLLVWERKNGSNGNGHKPNGLSEWEKIVRGLMSDFGHSREKAEEMATKGGFAR